MPGWSPEDRIRAWAIWGGMPYYRDELDPERDVAENVFRTILAPDGLLRDEPEFLLAQESRIRERDAYLSALRAIANGRTKLSEISERVQRPPAETRSFLETLEQMQLVERRRPVDRRAGKKVSYAITDPFLRFWFRFVAPFEGRLQSRDAARRHLEETMLPRLDAFVSRDAFEEVCQRWVLAHDAGELDELETVARLMGAAATPPLYFFDRTGFSPRLRALAREHDDVRLVTTAELAAG